MPCSLKQAQLLDCSTRADMLYRNPRNLSNVQRQYEHILFQWFITDCMSYLLWIMYCYICHISLLF
jgi:hypothetical protein